MYESYLGFRGALGDSRGEQASPVAFRRDVANAMRLCPSRRSEAFMQEINYQATSHTAHNHKSSQRIESQGT